jgi:excisionase family DNA binding protein
MPDNADTQHLLAHSIDSACESVNCGRSFLYGEIAEGRLTAKKMGRRTIVLDEDLRGWLARLPSFNKRGEVA